MKTFSHFLRILTVLVIIIPVLSACTTPLQKELLKYNNEDWPEAAKLEKKALDSYSSVTGANYKDDETMYAVITKEVLPTYKAFIEKLESISKNLTEEKVIKLNEECIKITKQQYHGFETIVEALEQQDAAKIQEAKIILSKAESDMENWVKDFDKLCEENSITRE